MASISFAIQPLGTGAKIAQALTLTLTPAEVVIGRMNRCLRTTTLEDLPDNVCLIIAQHLASICPSDMRSVRQCNMRPPGSVALILVLDFGYSLCHDCSLSTSALLRTEHYQVVGADSMAIHMISIRLLLDVLACHGHHFENMGVCSPV